MGHSRQLVRTTSYYGNQPKLPHKAYQHRHYTIYYLENSSPKPDSGKTHRCRLAGDLSGSGETTSRWLTPESIWPKLPSLSLPPLPGFRLCPVGRGDCHPLVFLIPRLSRGKGEAHAEGSANSNSETSYFVPRRSSRIALALHSPC